MAGCSPLTEPTSGVEVAEQTPALTPEAAAWTERFLSPDPRTPTQHRTLWRDHGRLSEADREAIGKYLSARNAAVRKDPQL
jgi:hypothetical protein